MRLPALTLVVAAAAASACASTADDPRYDCAPTGAPGTYAASLVRPGAAASLGAFLDGAEADFSPIVAELIAAHGDRYDFLYLLTADVPTTAASGRFKPVRRDAVPEIGLPAYQDASIASERLQGIAVMRFDEGRDNGPTLHETAHQWAQFLDPSLAFGSYGDTLLYSHWGLSGVQGQLGGFDPDTLRCDQPAGAVPPACTGADGRYAVTLAPFGPAANGGDALPYAPLELYLMGLLPAAEVPSPIPILLGGQYLGDVSGEDRVRYEVSGVRQVPMSEVLTTMGGERPLVPFADRALRAAFIIVTDAPPSDADLERAATWARRFGGAVDASPLLSFCEATGGLATLRTDL